MRLGRTSEILHGGGVRLEKVKVLDAGPAIAADAVALVRLGCSEAEVVGRGASPVANLPLNTASAGAEAPAAGRR